MDRAVTRLRHRQPAGRRVRGLPAPVQGARQRRVARAARRVGGRGAYEARARGAAEQEGEDWARWRVGEWEVDELRAARRAPECFGSWEYLVKWKRGEGEYPDSWEPAAVCAGAGLAEERRRAEAERCVPTSFAAWLEERGKREGATGREARVALKRMREAKREGDLRAPWRLFTEYDAAPSRWDVNDNARDLPPESAGTEGWRRDNDAQTYYRGTEVPTRDESGKETVT